MELLSFLAQTDQPRASVLIAHGFGEHHGRYLEFIAALNDAGYDAWAFDFEGHGKSPGIPACVDVARLIGAHLEARRELTFASRTEKIFLFGHSMGGLVTLASTLLDPHHIAATAVTGPALRPLPNVSVGLAKALRPVARLWPGLKTVTIDEGLLTHDQEKAAAYRADPLVYQGKVPLLTALTMTIQGDATLNNAPMLARPTLILHAGDDALASPEGSRQFAAQTEQAELRVIDETYHELLNEVERARYTQDIIDWYSGW